MNIKTFQILIFVVLAASACLPQRKNASGIDAVTAGLEITGSAALPGGLAAAGVDIYIERLQTPVAKSAADGTFTVKIDETALKNLQVSSTGQRTTYNLYFKLPGTIELAGMSPLIALSQRGSFSTGVISMQPASTIKGVILKAAGNVLNPAAPALITIGREQITTSRDGSFSLSGLPAGKIPVTIELAKFDVSIRDLEIKPGSNLVLEDPFVLFQNSSPAAVLLLRPWISSNAQPGTATTRTFKVLANPAAKFIRYSGRIDDISRPPSIVIATPSTTNPNTAGQPSTPVTVIEGTRQAEAPWRPLQEEISFSFSSEGPASLWYQVSDDAKAQSSDIQQVSLNINSCEGFSGLVLGDGSGVTRQRRTRVSFVGLPSNATRVRLTENVENLIGRPWLSLGSSIDYLFDVPSGTDNVPTASGLDVGVKPTSRILFAQIGTTSGDCPVVSAAVDLMVFPPTLSPGLLINGGAPITQSRFVQVDIPEIPPNAFEMRLTESLSQSSTTSSSSSTSSSNGTSSSSSSTTNQTPWLRVQPSTVFMFQGSGSRILNLQFRDADGLTSSNYRASIEVIPPQAADVQLSFAQINPLSLIIPPPPSRYIIMQLIPPQNAVAFRYMELISDNGNTNLGGANTNGNNPENASSQASDIVIQPWLNLAPTMTVYARGIGLRTFIVQYLLTDNATTTVQRSILVSPVLETLGDFWINGGSSLSVYPTVTLSVFPPPQAIAMSATNLTLLQTITNNSTTFSLGNAVGTTSTTSNDQWIALNSTLDFRIESRGVQTIQMRFRDPNGDVTTPAPARSIVYDPFPPYPIGTKPLVVNNDDPVTTSSAVKLRIIAPESVRAFRVSTDPTFDNASDFQDIPAVPKTTLPGVPWKAYVFEVDYILTGSTGPKIVYVDFRNELGDRGGALSDLIMYQP